MNYKPRKVSSKYLDGAPKHVTAIWTWITETEEYQEIKRRKLMVFHEWPSGHWDYTDKGRNFLMYQNEENS